jgi:hypothetical protein
MTPQERQLVDDLFDRLARLESAPRDPDAERAIIDGLRRAPNAVYALVQTVLVQDEALKRADARIRELSGDDDNSQQSPGFLDSMREAFLGRTRGSVPSVPMGRPSGADPRWNQGGAYQGAPAAPAQPYAQPPGGGMFGGGSFLGTAAASAAGMIAGGMLLNSISSMFGHHGGQAFASTPSASPWDNSAANSDLARDAGLNDVGGRGVQDSQPAGLFGADNDDNDYSDDVASDPGGDFDGGDFGGGDTA